MTYDISYGSRMPITVLMKDKSLSNLKVIAEYGQEYGKDNPIRVIYHGYGHLRCIIEELQY